MADQDDVIEGQYTETEVIGAPEDTADMLRQARELVPVGRSGTAPMNLAQQVDYARDMAKARFSIPAHLQSNVGDCLAVIDIATRANLSPYMLAGMTYLDPNGNRLAFMSQAYHALAAPWIVGELDVVYEGEGENLVCVVTGTLKADPKKPREHRSPTLKEVIPKRNDRGTVKGSPLWDKKPRVQLFYDTSRDWVRIYCPRATLGIYTPEDFADHGVMKDITPETATLTRERVSTADKTEGFKDGHVESELAAVMPEREQKVLPAQAETPITAKAEPTKEAKTTKTKKKEAPKEKPEAKPAPDTKTEATQEAVLDGQPKTSAQYIAYAEKKIDGIEDYDAARAWWDSDEEREMRDKLEVPIKARGVLANKIDHKFLD